VPDAARPSGTAHTSWFFEAVVLQAFQPGYRPFDARFGRLFNSYYESLGARHPRPQRGLLTRPALAEVLAYRGHVDAALQRFVDGADADTWRQAAPLVETGLQHEQQHQELILTDILHLLSQNPLAPAYRPPPATAPAAEAGQLVGVCRRQFRIDTTHVSFGFDNEGPRHRAMAPFTLARGWSNRE
jgi:hypothetical protein